VRKVLDLVSGGIAALNHRLKAGIPSACGSNTRNQKGQIFFYIPPSHLLLALKEFVGKSEGLLFLNDVR
jgi:TRAP-type mannitol/chloroaromatic compound transport system permease large subunit